MNGRAMAGYLQRPRIGVACCRRCSGENFSEAEKATIASMSLAALPPLPADPTNKYADDPAAAAFGATLFFDQRMSRDGIVACGTCHLIDRQFQDDLPRGKGVGVTNRRTMPLAGVAWSPWFFWDGRRDSLWAQALTPLEDPGEHAGTRAFYAHFVAENFAERYQRIFGPLPDLSDVPKHAGPLRNGLPRRRHGRAMSQEQQEGDQPRLCQSRQGDCRLRALDRAGGDALRPFCQGDCGGQEARRTTPR